MTLACEWCGQPAARTSPTLCAECYYKYWAKNRARSSGINASPEASPSLVA